MTQYLFTSESVTEGHPDKISDQISDAILDALLTKDANARVAVETAATTGLVLVIGEITTDSYVDIRSVVRAVVADAGYVGEHGGGFDANTIAVLTSLDEQSPDIANGVTKALEQRATLSEDQLDAIGAGDQGIIFGFATNETPSHLPFAIWAAHALAQRLAAVRKLGVLRYLRPDGKTQVTVEYKDGKPYRVHSIVISAQHDPVIDGIEDNASLQKRIERDIKQYVIQPVFEGLKVAPDEQTQYFINPSGRFVTGGPQGDAGLTGRKIIVDTYGGYARHGGGAFSGKDPTKVDRSAAYAARHAAKNAVAAGLGERVEVQIGYAIGVARPISIYATSYGTGVVDDEQLTEIIKRRFDFRPAAIIERFQLRDLPRLNGGRFYRNVAAYGHFGRTDLDLPWERLDQVETLKADLKQVQQGSVRK
jgi:S-adenosylmethionine synthetase